VKLHRLPEPLWGIAGATHALTPLVTRSQNVELLAVVLGSRGEPGGPGRILRHARRWLVLLGEAGLLVVALVMMRGSHLLAAALPALLLVASQGHRFICTWVETGHPLVRLNIFSRRQAPLLEQCVLAGIDFHALAMARLGRAALVSQADLWRWRLMWPALASLGLATLLFAELRLHPGDVLPDALNAATVGLAIFLMLRAVLLPLRFHARGSMAIHSLVAEARRRAHKGQGIVDFQILLLAGMGATVALAWVIASLAVAASILGKMFLLDILFFAAPLAWLNRRRFMRSLPALVLRWWRRMLTEGEMLLEQLVSEPLESK